jgi:valyl-tRNA synthetase
MSMKKNFNSQTSEAAILSAWETNRCFAAGANAKKGAASFSIMIPPPNVTGSLHMGHAFNTTLQDILIRWHRMRGFDTLWQPGQDHAGIATQMVVERKLAQEKLPSREDLGREKFLEKVWEWKEESGDTIVNQLKRLGASCDWDRNRFTMDKGFHDAVLKVFVEMYNKEFIYKGKRLVNWDPHFETAISDLEVENVETDGKFWHFKYPLANGEFYNYIEKDEDGEIILEEQRNFISIATTRPETMLGDGAVAVHPDDERYAAIIGKQVHLPLCNRSIPIITDEYPDPKFGSGAVKITGAHDFNDYEVALRNNIPLYALMDSKGNMRLDDSSDNLVPKKYRGLSRFDARKLVVKDIDAIDLLIMIEDKKVMQPYGDRSKVVIEPMLTDQWFVDAQKIVQPAISAVEQGRTKILPERDKKVYFHWLKNIEPWCISRQLWWGHQIPVWYDEEGNQFCAVSEEEAVLMSGGKKLIRDPDVLDTWFSSGLWPIGTLGWPEKTEEFDKYFPTDVLVTGFDIIFFWVARMMMMQLAVVEKEPFHTVYVHALVRDENGKKMSKSLGNVLDPLEQIDEYGADAVRFTLTAMAAMGRDLKLSTQRVIGYRNFGTKLWNAARFAEFNECKPIEDFDPSAVSQILNKWIIGEVAKSKEAMDDALNQYRFNDTANVLYTFVWGKVCDWYVELSKPLFQGDDLGIKQETQNTLAWVIDQCLIMLHPIMPFITEQLWSDIADRSNMLIHEDWPEYQSVDLVDIVADSEMNWVISIIENIRSVRSEMNVNAGAKIDLIILEFDVSKKVTFNENLVMIKRLARLKDISHALEAPKGSVTLTVEGGTVCLPLSEVIDLSAEKNRLQKLLDKLTTDIGITKKRVDNVKFAENAPANVLAENKQRLVQWNSESEKLIKAIHRLNKMS